MEEPYFAKYLRRIEGTGDLVALLEEQSDRFLKWSDGVSAEEALAVHPPYRWTVCEVVNHLSDCERVFAYRALWLARVGGGELPSFDEMAFAANAGAKEISWKKLTEEFLAVRSGSIWLFENLPTRGWLGRGRAAGFDVDVRMLCAMICGHFDHHFDILQQRRSGVL
jgi:hypothetical protein